MEKSVIGSSCKVYLPPGIIGTRAPREREVWEEGLSGLVDHKGAQILHLRLRGLQQSPFALLIQISFYP